MSENNLLSVVETIPNVKYSLFLENLEKPEFWESISPVKETKLEFQSKGFYTYKGKDRVIIEPITNMHYDFDFTGEIHYEAMSTTPEKGHMFHIEIKVKETNGIAKTKIRAKDTPQGLKVGIFLYHLEYVSDSVIPISKDAVLFAARYKIREGIEKIIKKFNK
jgi:hypothetical protein